MGQPTALTGCPEMESVSHSTLGSDVANLSSLGCDEHMPFWSGRCAGQTEAAAAHPSDRMIGDTRVLLLLAWIGGVGEAPPHHHIAEAHHRCPTPSVTDETRVLTKDSTEGSACRAV